MTFFATDWLAAFLIAAGPFVGSFVGTLTLRWPAGESVVVGRSACQSCRATLGWRDLVPIASWIAARGRCRRCGAAIGFLYPVTEAAALGVGVWAAFVFSGIDLALVCVLGWALLALALIDARTMLLPDLLTLPILVLGLALAGFEGRLIESLWGAGIGFALFAAIAAGYWRWRQRDGLGLGDAKLLAAAGAWVGWAGLPGIVLVASVTALVVAVPMVMRRRVGAGTVEIAFGPYLAAAMWITVVHGPIVIA
jgi:leader peptidase (prepilin peptidase) / N-methyltransferase